MFASSDCLAGPPAVEFVILNPTDGTVDGSITVQVVAQDVNHIIDWTYQNDVCLNVSGSATGDGLVDIVSGFGSLQISNTVAETVDLSLYDCMGTGLDVSSIQDVVFGLGVATQVVVIDPTDGVTDYDISVTIQIQDQYGNIDDDASETVAITTDGNAVISGVTTGTGDGSYDSNNESVLSDNGIIVVTVHDGTVETVNINVDHASLIDTSTQDVIFGTSIYISACQELNQSGRTYILTVDIVNMTFGYELIPHCFNITADNITFGCQNHIIDGNMSRFLEYAHYPTGIDVNNQTGVTIKNCIVTDWGTGIYAHNQTSDIVITNNTLESNFYGMFLDNSEHGEVTDNVMRENRQRDLLVIAVDFNDCGHVITDNIGSGNRPILYYNDTVTIENNHNISQLTLCNAQNSVISNVTIRGSDTLDNNGLYIHLTNNSNFTDVDSSNNYRGITIDDCFNNILKDSVFAGNDLGIYAYNDYNLIYNNLFNNTLNVQQLSGINKWNTTKQTGNNIHNSSNPYIGGNYWTNSTGNGYSDTCTDTNNDGFCNNSYTVASNNIDYHPLSDEYSPSVTDTDPPLYSAEALYPPSDSVYSYYWSYQFNLTWTDNISSIDTVWIEENMTGSLANHTVSSHVGDVYYYDISGLGAGSYVYKWYANDTDGNVNDTFPLSIYTIGKAKPILTISNDTYSVNTSGLVGYWRFEEGSGNFTSDLSGYDNDGDIYGSPIWKAFEQVESDYNETYMDSVDETSWRVLVKNSYITASNENNIRLHLFGCNDTATYMDSVYIAEMDSDERNVVDGTWTQVLFDSNDYVLISAGDDIFSDLFDFSVNISRNYSVTFHTNTSCEAYYNGTLTNQYTRLGDYGDDKDWSDNSPNTSSHISFLMQIDEQTINSPNWVDGRFGGALKFDGDDDYVNCGNGTSLDITGAMTIEAWVKKTTTTGEAIIQKYKFTSPYEGYGLLTEASTGKLRFYTDGNGWELSTGSITDGNWHHVAVTGIGSSGKFYIDGLPSGTFIYGSPSDNIDEILYIGASEGTFSKFNGTIDEVRIHNRALSPEEITLSYQSGIVEGTQTTFTGSESNEGDDDVTYTLYRNLTLASNPDVQTLNDGYYYYFYNTSGGANFTERAVLIPLYVEEAYLSINFIHHISVSWTDLNHNTTDNAAVDQISGLYNVTLDTNAAWELVVESTEPNVDTVYWFENINETLSVDINTSSESLSVGSSILVGNTENPSQVHTGLALGSITTYFHGYWLDVPQFQWAGSYSWTITEVYQLL